MSATEFKKIRDALKLSQAEFAKRLGLHVITISVYENGHKEIPIAIGLAAKQLLSEG